MTMLAEGRIRRGGLLLAFGSAQMARHLRLRLLK